MAGTFKRWLFCTYQKNGIVSNPSQHLAFLLLFLTSP